MTKLLKVATAVFTSDDLLYAMENAAEFLDNEEWPHDDGTDREGSQCAANAEAAKRIRREPVGAAMPL